MIFLPDKKLEELSSSLGGIQIECILDGGLGNQIFQFLAAAKLQKDLGIRRLLLNIRNYQDDFFRRPEILKLAEDIPSSLAHYPESIYIKCFKRLKMHHFGDAISGLGSGIYRISDQENCPSRSFANALSKIIIKSKLSQAKTRRIILSGFWQDPRLHDSDHALSLRCLNLDSKIINKAMPDCYIAIHVRRGDYISNKDNALEYFSRHSQLSHILTSIHILPSEFKGLPIIVCSDDPAWCQVWIESLRTNGHNIMHSQAKTSLEDWLIINRSLVAIIPNSSFSFTAAWLNQTNLANKLRVILPQWYTRTITMQEKGWESIPGAYAI